MPAQLRRLLVRIPKVLVRKTSTLIRCAHNLVLVVPNLGLGRAKTRRHRVRQQIPAIVQVAKR
jgi:hypothetical protein